MFEAYLFRAFPVPWNDKGEELSSRLSLLVGSNFIITRDLQARSLQGKLTLRFAPEVVVVPNVISCGTADKCG